VCLNMRTLALLVLFCRLLCGSLCQGQTSNLSQVWNPDLGDGRYKNPILFADYSDPDVIRLGADFYMVSSSFESVPGIPILHSHDLVHWEIVGHALTRLMPEDRYESPRHGDGVWAPSIRLHDGKFYIFYPDPDYGVYMIRAASIVGPWSKPVLVKAAKGWIDPCPFWDSDGKAYLVNALAASRAGAKSVILVSRMSPDATHVLDDGAIAIDGHGLDETLEGPKIYKRAGYYYIFAPSGGVTHGQQIVFRSRSIYGPYERRVVLAQGSTSINGPHQGAWVNTLQGEDWFIHFQDRGIYGRVTDLEPMKWGENGWPTIGVHQDAQGTGEPVEIYRRPRSGAFSDAYNPADSDEFAAATIGAQWSWQANPGTTWAFAAPGTGALRLIDAPCGQGSSDLRALPNVLLQKLPGPAFTATAKVHFSPKHSGDETGLVVLGKSYSALILEQGEDGVSIRVESRDADLAVNQGSQTVAVNAQEQLYLRATMNTDLTYQFSFSMDGHRFQPLGKPIAAVAGIWIGARIGIYACGSRSTGEFGYADYDWFQFKK
jgi:beta-xylosidase